MARALAGGFDVTAATRPDLDINDESRVRAVVAGLRPGVIVNCAAYNAVDDAEDDAAEALAVNLAAATVGLLRAAPARGVYHCVGSGHATWFEVAAALAEEPGVEPVVRGASPWTS